MIEKDIKLCDELIKKNFASEDDVKCLVSKYRKIDNTFGKELHNYVKTINHSNNEIKNIIIIKSELEALLMLDGITEDNSKAEIQLPNINFYNTINNNISVLSNAEIEKIINDNPEIEDSEKKELLNKLDEITELQKSNATKQEKWKKAKTIIAFLIDKGADIFIMYLPKIIAAIQGGING
jgi:hypothetical protein